MNACRLLFEVSGRTPNPSVPVSEFTVFGTVAHPFTNVDVSVRTLNAGPPLFLGTAIVAFPPPSTPNPADPANDGSWQITFSSGLLPLPCGLNLLIEAHATAADATVCPDSGWRPIRCKLLPAGDGGSGSSGGGGAGPGGGGGGGGAEGEHGWTWPDPPHIACPRWGRSFTATLAAGAALLMAGIALSSPALATAGATLILVAAALFTFWRSWCVPSTCVLLGAVIWVMKRATILGAVLSAVTLSAPGLCATIAAGSVTGALVAEARRRRCLLPRAALPLNQLPMW